MLIATLAALYSGKTVKCLFFACLLLGYPTLDEQSLINVSRNQARLLYKNIF